MKWCFDLIDLFKVDTGGVTSAFQHFDEAFRRVVSRSEAHGTDGGIDAIHAGLNRLHQADQRDAGGGMDMEMNPQIMCRRPLLSL